jgi:rhodanese-related sulfurtransferase
MNEQIQKLRHNTKAGAEFFGAKLAFTLGPVELSEMLKDKKVKLIDVRHKEDFEKSHIPEAVNIEKIELEQKLSTLSKADVHVVCCYSQQCHLAASAAYFLTKHDYPAMELEGGFDIWKSYNFPTT